MVLIKESPIIYKSSYRLAGVNIAIASKVKQLCAVNLIDVANNATKQFNTVTSKLFPRVSWALDNK